MKAFLQDKLTAHSGDWSVSDNQNTALIVHRPSGASLRAIASDPRRAHGRAPGLILADEPAQWTPSTSEKMVAALQTSMGKIPGSRMIALGTRAESDSHWFSKWLNGGADYAQTHAASDTDKPFQKRTWVKANPSLPHMPNLEAAIRSESENAKIDDTVMQSFRALRLNQGVSDVGAAILLEANTWRQLVKPTAYRLPKARTSLGSGLRFGRGNVAIAAYEPLSGRLEVVAAFPTIPSLLERGKKDAVSDLYVRMHRPGRTDNDRWTDYRHYRTGGNRRTDMGRAYKPSYAIGGVRANLEDALRRRWIAEYACHTCAAWGSSDGSVR